MHRISCWQRTFSEAHSDVLAVFCSDGRYARYMDEFLEQTLRVEGADWLAVPGGPAAMGPSRREECEHEAIWSNIEFLIAAHDTRRLLLVFHEACGYYKDVLGDSWTQEAARQRAEEDARAIRDEATRRHPSIEVEIYWHRGGDAAVYLEEMAGTD